MSNDLNSRLESTSNNDLKSIKSDKPTITDDELTTEWTPEIPFRNLNKLEENGLNRADSNLTETKPDQHLSILATAEEVYFS
uniref:Uncharacterized protein n=1 Tax=Megaselia scalaris TaxID=36166 RepID=T1GD61_MEGSC